MLILKLDNDNYLVMLSNTGSDELAPKESTISFNDNISKVTTTAK